MQANKQDSFAGKEIEQKLLARGLQKLLLYLPQ
jgi:hypothetical protein